MGDMSKSVVISRMTDDEISVSVSPNPTLDYIVVSAEEGSDINIVDAQKITIYNTTVISNDTRINLLNFDKGIYSLIVKNPNGSRVVKILKI